MAYMALCIEENRSDTEKNQHVQYVAHGLPRVENSSTVSAKEKKTRFSVFVNTFP